MNANLPALIQLQPFFSKVSPCAPILPTRTYTVLKLEQIYSFRSGPTHSLLTSVCTQPLQQARTLFC